MRTKQGHVAEPRRWRRARHLRLGRPVRSCRQGVRRAVAFWAAALGYVRREQDWDPAFMMVADPAGRACQFPPAGHLDLYTSEHAVMLSG